VTPLPLCSRSIFHDAAEKEARPAFQAGRAFGAPGMLAD